MNYTKDKTGTGKHPQCCLGDRGHMRGWVTETQNYLETDTIERPHTMVLFTVWRHAEGLVSCQCLNNSETVPLAKDKSTVKLNGARIWYLNRNPLQCQSLFFTSYTHTALCVYQPVSDHGSAAGVWVSVCVHADLESRELMQAGLWQSSCPSARLIMQERHSRPPFILPGGEAVPACSAYHMALAPLSSLLSRSFSLYWGCCGWRWWWRRSVFGVGGYWWCGGTPQHAV